MSKRKTPESQVPLSKMNFFSPRSPPSTTPSSSLIAFYEGFGGDHRGRNVDDILKWSVGKLESSHDYIQTLFPLPEESGVNWKAPTIDREVFNAFRSRPELRQKLRESFQRMLWFYGFELKDEEDGVMVVQGANYAKNSENWNTRFDHNHLRITRIIRCLRVLGLPNEALAFREALEAASTQASSRSREFWRRAAQRDLNLRPDLEINDEEDNRIGQRFLREYELKRKEESQEDEAALVRETKVEMATAEAVEAESRTGEGEMIGEKPGKSQLTNPSSGATMHALVVSSGALGPADKKIANK